MVIQSFGARRPEPDASPSVVEMTPAETRLTGKVYRMRLAVILFIGLTATRLAAAAGHICAEVVQHSVERFVREEMADLLEENHRVEVHTRWRVPIELVTPGEPKIEIVRLSDRPLSGPTVLGLRLLVDGQPEKEASVTADIRHRRPALVARGGMRRGDTLAPDGVDLKEVDVTSARGRIYTDISQIEGLRLTRSVRAGELISGAHTEPVPVVFRGDAVVLAVVSHNLRVTATAVALQDGGPGERIRVRNADSGTVVQGRVIDAGEVRIVLH